MVRLYPLFHPAAALRTPRVKEELREDFSRLPALLAEGAPPQPEDEVMVQPAGREPPRVVDQLGLFG